MLGSAQGSLEVFTVQLFIFQTKPEGSEEGFLIVIAVLQCISESFPCKEPLWFPSLKTESEVHYGVVFLGTESRVI